MRYKQTSKQTNKQTLRFLLSRFGTMSQQSASFVLYILWLCPSSLAKLEFSQYHKNSKSPVSNTHYRGPKAIFYVVFPSIRGYIRTINVVSGFCFGHQMYLSEVRKSNDFFFTSEKKHIKILSQNGPIMVPKTDLKSGLWHVNQSACGM